MKRATVIEHSMRSEMNQFTVPSDFSDSHAITADHNRRLINEIVDRIFDDRKGTIDISSSECTSPKAPTSEYSWDKRLKYWEETLKERRRLGLKIQRKTDKRPDEILFNRYTTLDDRNKRTVQRLIDYANRMEPLKLLNVQPRRLKEKLTHETCLPVSEIQETLPKAEQKKHVSVEISGLPDVVKREILGRPRLQGKEKPYHWLKSKVLERRIEEISDNIERVIEYYPDIDNLQIVGHGLLESYLPRHSSDIVLLPKYDITEISSESTDLCVGKVEEIVEKHEEPIKPNYALSVNDVVYEMSNKSLAKNVSFDVSFVGQPFERQTKTVVKLQNVGRKTLNLDWTRRAYYGKASTLLKPLDCEFLFDRKPFRLYPGEETEISITYQPRRVDAVKDKWILRVDPQLFYRRLDGIIIKLYGTCYAPPEYENKIATRMRSVINKSNMKMMRELTDRLGDLTPLIKTPEVKCPYQRILNQMELFEQLNPGFKCERYHDVELLRDLYERARKRRQCPWNLKIDSLKCTILQVSDPEQRALYINELAGLIEPLRGKSVDLETRMLQNPEVERTKFIFVRGAIAANIDEWEDLAMTLEETYFKRYLPKFLEEVEEYNLRKQSNTLEEGEEEHEVSPRYPPLDDEDRVRKYIMTRRIRRWKCFRDALYVQTYSFVCNCAEDIVNLIESTVAV